MKIRKFLKENYEWYEILRAYVGVLVLTLLLIWEIF